MRELIQEGRAKIKVLPSKKISKEMDVFYNPVMKLNRDISVLLLNSINKNKLIIADPLAGSGIRSIRFLLELKKNKIKSISINDYSEKAVRAIKENLQLNKIRKNKKIIIIINDDANFFLLNSRGFDYIDVDPFGSPNFLLNSAVVRLSRSGILAVTATDTSALAGTYPEACLRKYWAKPLKNELMHEIGLRILIRKVQLVGVQFNKALLPIFSYSKDHYMRVFFECRKSKEECDKVLQQHGFFQEAGPVWLGNLWDEKLAGKMVKNNKIEENAKFLRIIQDESKINIVGFYDLHKLRTSIRKDKFIKKIKDKGYKASETHFTGTGIRSNIEAKELKKLI